jgi:hypothetical protein
VRSLSPVEAAVCVAVAGSVLAVGVPAFVRNLRASHLAEPLDGLARIAATASAKAQGQPVESAYPETVGLTPAAVPEGEPAVDPPGTWQHPTWQHLGFSFSEAHSYSFAFDSERDKGVARFRATAHGDLDGDGELSEFSVAGEVRPGEEPRTFSVEMRREVE